MAMYLPQFHTIPENDTFWGKGFTDWKTVKAAKPLYKDHAQPKIPYEEHYYDLSLKENVEWQCKLAKEYGISAFGVYHYWFNDNANLLTKPAEIMRDSSSMYIKYFFTWDNCSWVRSWSNVKGNDWSPLADQQQSNKGPMVLVEYILGAEKNWEQHYNYIRSHLFSNNYLKINNRPVFSIINYNPEINRMCEYWNKLAIKDGFAGIYFIFKYQLFKEYPADLNFYNYEPHFSAWGNIGSITRVINAVRRRLKLEKKIYIYDYDKVWKSIIKNASEHPEKNFFHGAFVGYDDSPRRGMKRSRIIIGGTPQKFEKYLTEILNISKHQEKELVFLTAWNEWSEGAYVEPDEQYQFAYLQAIRNAVNKASPK